MSGKNVIFCEVSKRAILETITKVISNNFLDSIQNMINPYGDGRSAKRAYDLIKRLDFKQLLQKIEDPLC
jgi:UDP-N-acetylglucosamine 2-epimerase